MPNMKKLIAILLLCFVAPFVGSAVAAETGSGPLPIIFVHGNGDDAAKWIPIIWLFESNGYPADRLFAIRFTDPSAGTNDAVEEPFHSSTTDEAAELSAFVTRVLIQTHSRQVVLVGSSRGGLDIRNYLQNGGGQHSVAAAILCGTPNHGVMVSARPTNNEFDGGGPFLKALNSAYPDGSEVVPGVQMMTLRSDKLDKYAQPTAIAFGRPETATGVTYTGPELKGAKNVVLVGEDHRELAFSPEAFAQMFQFITGKEPKILAPVEEQKPVVSGLITSYAGAAPTNRALAGVHLRIYAVGPQADAAAEKPVYEMTTNSTGAWGPFTADQHQNYEFDLEADGRHVRFFKAPIPRSTSLLNLRFMPVSPEMTTTAQTSRSFLVARPQGYFSRERDPVSVNGEVSAEEPPGLPNRDSFLVHLAKPLDRVEVRLRKETIEVRPSEDLSKDLSIADFLW